MHSGRVTTLSRSSAATCGPESVLDPSLAVELRRLAMPRDHHVIIGSGPLAVRGLRPAANLDVMLTDALWDQLEPSHGIDDRYGTLLLARRVEGYRRSIFAQWREMPAVEEWIAGADVFDDLPFLSLEHTIAFKRAQGREKDLEDIRLIQGWLDRA
jgi:hypothetical protein